MSAVGDLGGTNEAVWYVADLDFFLLLVLVQT